MVTKPWYVKKTGGYVSYVKKPFLSFVVRQKNRSCTALESNHESRMSSYPTPLLPIQSQLSVDFHLISCLLLTKIRPIPWQKTSALERPPRAVVLLIRPWALSLWVCHRRGGHTPHLDSHIGNPRGGRRREAPRRCLFLLLRYLYMGHQQRNESYQTASSINHIKIDRK
jgi:hypothetical protein